MYVQLGPTSKSQHLKRVVHKIELSGIPTGIRSPDHINLTFLKKKKKMHLNECIAKIRIVFIIFFVR